MVALTNFHRRSAEGGETFSRYIGTWSSPLSCYYMCCWLSSATRCRHKVSLVLSSPYSICLGSSIRGAPNAGTEGEACSHNRRGEWHWRGNSSAIPGRGRSRLRD